MIIVCKERPKRGNTFNINIGTKKTSLTEFVATVIFASKRSLLAKLDTGTYMLTYYTVESEAGSKVI